MGSFGVDPEWMAALQAAVIVLEPAP